MKTLFHKFRISSALDSGKPLPPDLQCKTDASKELHSFHQSALSLETRLKETVPSPTAPASLQANIMRQIRSQSVPAPRRLPTAWRWLPIPATACLLLLLGWALTQRTVNSKAAPALSSATTAIQFSGQIAQNAPDKLAAPLSQELEHLNRDIDNAGRFLLAALP